MTKIEVKRVVVFRIFLLIVLTFVVFQLFGLIIPLVIKGDLGATKIEESLSEDKFLVFVDFFNYETRSNTITADFAKVQLPPHSFSNADRRVCIEKLWILAFRDVSTYYPNIISSRRDNSVRFQLELESRNFGSDFCMNKETISRDTGEWYRRGFYLDVKPLTTTFSTKGTSSYYFPFDHRSLDVFLSLEGYVETSSNNDIDTKQRQPLQIAPNVTGWIIIPEWEVSTSYTTGYVYTIDSISEGKVVCEINPISSEHLSSEHATAFAEEKSTCLHLKFKRPLVYRVLTVVLLGSILLFIILLIFVKETSTFMEVAVGILFSLWGVRGVLIPSNVTWPNIIEPLILILYACLALAAFIRVFIRPTWYWFDSRSESETLAYVYDLEKESQRVRLNEYFLGTQLFREIIKSLVQHYVKRLKEISANLLKGK